MNDKPNQPDTSPPASDAADRYVVVRVTAAQLAAAEYWCSIIDSAKYNHLFDVRSILRAVVEAAEAESPFGVMLAVQVSEDIQLHTHLDGASLASESAVDDEWRTPGVMEITPDEFVPLARALIAAHNAQTRGGSDAP